MIEIEVLPLIPSIVAVTVIGPSNSGVTMPPALINARAGGDTDHVTGRPRITLPYASFAVALMSSDPRMLNKPPPGAETETVATIGAQIPSCTLVLTPSTVAVIVTL